MSMRTKKKKNTHMASRGRIRRWRVPLVSAVVAVILGGGWAVKSLLWHSETWQRSPEGAFKGFNLLLVSIDTLRTDRLGCYGSKAGLTPNVDRLAAEGIRFENVLAHVPLTLPSHTSLFTARYPTDHGVHDNGTFRVDPNLPTLATIVKRAGYQTAAFIGAFVLDARFGLNRGFDHYDDYYGEKRAFQSFAEAERRAESVVAPAEQWIGERQSGPWYVWVHLFDPHAPYDAPPSYQASHPDDPYGAEVAYTDAVLGSFFERLGETGHLKDTLVVIVGDHGESLGDHGERTHGTFAYNSTLRVPWILWAEENLRPQVFAPWVRHVDVMPTVLAMLGIASPDHLAGRSLWPFLTGEREYTTPPAYFEALNVHLTRDWPPLRGVVKDGYKLIHLPIPELYELDKDRAEMHNIYQDEPETAERLEAELQTLSAGTLEIEANPPDPETLQKLRALGYVTTPIANRRSHYTEADDPKRLIDVSNAYDDATDLFAQGKTTEAVRLLEDLTEKQPRSSQAYQKLAYALHQIGRLEDAIHVLKTALEKGVLEMSLVALLGAYTLEAGRAAEARVLLEDLVHRHPEYAEGHNYLGVAYGQLGLLEQARSEFERVLELDPSSAQTYNNLGSLALSRGDFGEAIRILKRALDFDPDLASAHNGLGVAYARSGDMEGAAESWRRAVELNPRNFDALYNLAMVVFERSPRQAAPYLERFVRDAPRPRYQADIVKAQELLRRIK